MKYTADLDTRKRKVIVLLSSDTEFDPPTQDGTWRKRSTSSLLEGLRRLLDLCDEYGVPATLYCEGKLVVELPDLFRELARHHEIGCHSFSHEWLGTRPPSWWIPHREEFTVLSTDEKASVLKRASESIEKTIGKRPRSFKAPFNSVDHPSTLALLEQVGFETDSSLPCYNTESFINPLRPAPTRHASAHNLWSAGTLHLIEVPFMIRPRPLLFHPFDIREEVVDTIPRGMKLALESVDIQCRIDYLSGTDFSVVQVTSHPWEFSNTGPWGHKGSVNAERLASYLRELSSLYEAQFLTVAEFTKMWENECCRWHSTRRGGQRQDLIT
jgi:peptidoglycan/xylan/chitin deacetylase (PgdA/CDA1 family)